MLYFAAGTWTRPGAMFTASHNPAGTTASSSASPAPAPWARTAGLDRDQGGGRRRSSPARPPAGHPAPGRAQDLLGDFADHVRSFVDTIASAPLKVVADTANGMGGLVVPAVFEGLPFDLEIMYGELDGTFPNHPADPIQPENQRDLRARVRRGRCRHRAGLRRRRRPGVPGRRAGRAGSPGRPPPPSSPPAMLASESRRDGHPQPDLLQGGARGRPRARRHAGAHPGRAPFIKAEMAETGAVFGGEHSAHYYFRDNFRADSGLIAALVVLEQMATAGEAAVGAARAVRALRRIRARSTPGRRPGGRDRAGGGPLRRMPARTDSTASPWIWATGGSTCGHPTPSRCCGSTSEAARSDSL